MLEAGDRQLSPLSGNYSHSSKHMCDIHSIFPTVLGVSSVVTPVTEEHAEIRSLAQLTPGVRVCIHS